VVCQL